MIECGSSISKTTPPHHQRQHKLNLTFWIRPPPFQSDTFFQTSPATCCGSMLCIAYRGRFYGMAINSAAMPIWNRPPWNSKRTWSHKWTQFRLQSPILTQKRVRKNGWPDEIIGTPGPIRTSGLRIRSLNLSDQVKSFQTLTNFRLCDSCPYLQPIRNHYHILPTHTKMRLYRRKNNIFDFCIFGNFKNRFKYHNLAVLFVKDIIWKGGFIADT